MQRMLDAFKEDVFDVLIVGGGITGAGVALDAATRGLKVALIDKGDFASATSCSSSKLVHGGLRYLEHGDFPLVYEALQERKRLLRNAPHLVWPLRFLLPFYQGARVPGWKWRVGLTLYDLLAGRDNLQHSRGVPRARLLRECPRLRAERLAGGAQYFDAQMDDARLCLEVLQTAVKHGAHVANYVEVRDFERSGSLLCGVRAVDHVHGEELSIQALQVVNATGPWVDRLCALAGETDPPRLRPTRGSHLILPDQGLPCAFLLLHPRDGRVFFVLPWLGKTVIGTTDLEEAHAPDEIAVTPEERAYLLDGYNAHFSPPLDSKAILGSFIGVRPLLASHPGEPSARSREFRLFWSPSGLLSLAGGKYTTFRHMAEIITDAICARLGRRRLCRTRHLRLVGTPEEPWPDFRRQTIARLERLGLDTPAAVHLVQRYGCRAEMVAQVILSRPGLLRRAHPEEPDLAGEFLYQRQEEMALVPTDFLLRRTHLGLFHPEMLSRAADGLPGKDNQPDVPGHEGERARSSGWGEDTGRASAQG